MIEVYADDDLIYDSRMEHLDLEQLKATTGINVGGTATITMPRSHPACNRFVPLRTVVTIFRDGKLRFRGRSLFAQKSFYEVKTVPCEGELCFLRDGIMRPYSFDDTPANIFTAVLTAYNEQVDQYKQFVVGEVTVTDPAGNIQLKNEQSEKALDTVNALIKKCGGTIVFTTNEDGFRVINWYASLDRKSNQSIEFGENLLDFSCSESDEEGIITGLVPYGAKDKKTGQRITIESVNEGKDYILDEAAATEYGRVFDTVIFDDITEPKVLLQKTQELLDQKKRLIVALKLTALDLSHLDKSLDSFSVGDFIFVNSLPHKVAEYFQLTELTEDFLKPASSTIQLGKNAPSLTGSAGSESSYTVGYSTSELLARIVSLEEQISKLSA